MTLLSMWFQAFAVTIAVELLITVPLLPRHEPRLRRILAQMCTHPIVWFVWSLFDWPHLFYTLVAESFAVTTEAMFYAVVFASLRKQRALIVAIVANVASWGVGYLWGT